MTDIQLIILLILAGLVAWRGKPLTVIAKPKNSPIYSLFCDLLARHRPFDLRIYAADHGRVYWQANPL